MVLLLQEIKLLTFIGGIYTFYLLYAIAQEKITKTEYGEGERFTFTFFMLLIQCTIGGLTAFFCILFSQEKKNTTPQSKFMIIAVLYLAAMFASNAALVYVPYPTQVLAKACKPIPVMLVGFLFLRKKYRVLEWLCVLLIVIGIALFLMKDKPVAHDVDQLHYWIGVGLLLLSLLCDGFTGPLQEKIFASSKPSALRMMMLNNLYASIICFVCAFVFTNQGMRAIEFCQKYPEVWQYLGIASVLAALGQVCIFLLVSQFGALACSITTTTRKFFTILVSILYYGHQLSDKQWLGVFLVFIGLSVHVAYGKMKQRPANQKKHEE
mmetsp:Transcript_124062/g.185423  ORF Transcript_124062/g.185423 Transcript_124062/m.185423 type:complete len:323 (+) Transcript_124062:15-983(+)